MNKPPKPTAAAKAFVITPGGRSGRGDKPTEEELERGRVRRRLEDALDEIRIGREGGEIWD